MQFNPMSPEFRRDPYPFYAELRREAPVHRSDFGLWLISRYDDVVFTLKRHDLFSSTAMNMNVHDKPTRTVINTDPPVHTRMRNIVNRAFTPKMVADMEPRIREVTRELLDAVIERGEMDFVRDFAVPLPVTIIAEILGVDASRRDDFKRWSSASVGMAPVGDERRDMQEFFAYFEEAIAERRRPRGDLISIVVQASEGEEPLTADEVLAFTGLLLIAGNETTTNLLGNAVYHLLRNPDQLQIAREDPSIIPNVVEEALRFDSPVQFLFRRTTQDVDVAGVTIPAGSEVSPIYASANRDGRRFPDPDRFDVRRNAQGHVAFGHGVHFCLGAPLARLEARVALEEVLGRLAGIELKGADEPERLNSLFLRGFASLPLAFEPATAPV